MFGLFMVPYQVFLGVFPSFLVEVISAFLIRPLRDFRSFLGLLKQKGRS